MMFDGDFAVARHDTMTLSSKFQMSVPKAVREAKQWKAGQVFAFVPRGEGAVLAADLPDRARWIVPTIVQLELAKWLTREVDEDKAALLIAFTETCVVVDLDSRIALSAADFASRHRLAIADAIIYATAQALGADLLTCDRHFDGLPGVRFIANTKT